MSLAQRNGASDAIGKPTEPICIAAMDPIESLSVDLKILGLKYDIDIAVLAYLGCIARRIGKAQWIAFTGHTNSGKSFIKETIAMCMPREEVLDWTDVTDATLKRMALSEPKGFDVSQFIFERDERNERQKDPAYWRTLYSKGETSLRWVEGGQAVAVTLIGRPAVLETTTATGGMFEEDQNRRLILPVNESDEKSQFVTEQTMARYAAGVKDQRHAILEAHQKLQVAIPRLEGVDVPFRWAILQASAGGVPRSAGGRVTEQLMDIIGAVALLRHENRQVDRNYIVAELDDYRVAQTLLTPLHLRIVADIPAQDIEIIRQIGKGVSILGTLDPRRSAFNRLDISKWTGLPRSTLQRHLDRIASNGQLVVVQQGCRGRSHTYALTGDWEERLEGRPIFPTAEEVESKIAEK